MSAGEFSQGGFAFEPGPAGWLVGRFRSLTRAGFAHLVTTRKGPDPALIRDDRAKAASDIARFMNIDGLAAANQVHGGKVRVVDGPGLAGECDGLISQRQGVGVMGLSADCPIVLVADPATRAVGMAHASWRGTVREVTRNVVTRMVSLGADPGNLLAAIAPSAGPCCYEVGPDVLREFRSRLGPRAERFFRPREHRPGKYLLDLWAANVAQLVKSGVERSRVCVSGVCTMCRNDLLPSYRCEGKQAGRFAAALAAG